MTTEQLECEIERLKRFHAEDIRVTNESADYHIKLCRELERKIDEQGRGLIDAAHRLAIAENMTATLRHEHFMKSLKQIVRETPDWVGWVIGLALVVANVITWIIIAGLKW